MLSFELSKANPDRNHLPAVASYATRGSAKLYPLGRAKK